jgi:general secretion pathway protein J
MTRGRVRARRAVAGFTLIEALAAVMLMGMVVAAFATVTAQWMPNWNRGFARVQRSELLDVALARLVADLSAAEFVPADRTANGPLFEGTELGVTFVRSGFGPNTRPGLEIVRIAETADRNGPALVRSRTPFVPVAAAAQFPAADPVVLLRAPYRVTFAYAGQDRAWRNAWVGATVLPSAVRLTVRDAVTQRALSVSTATVIHAELPAACVGKEGRDCGGAPRRGAKRDTPNTNSNDADGDARSRR